MENITQLENATFEPILVSRIGSRVQYRKMVPVLDGRILYSCSDCGVWE